MVPGIPGLGKTTFSNYIQTFFGNNYQNIHAQIVKPSTDILKSISQNKKLTTKKLAQEQQGYFNALKTEIIMCCQNLKLGKNLIIIDASYIDDRILIDLKQNFTKYYNIQVKSTKVTLTKPSLGGPDQHLHSKNWVCAPSPSLILNCIKRSLPPDSTSPNKPNIVYQILNHVTLFSRFQSFDNFYESKRLFFDHQIEVSFHNQGFDPQVPKNIIDGLIGI